MCGAAGMALGLLGWAMLGTADSLDAVLSAGLLLFLVGPFATALAVVGLALLSRDAPPSASGVGMDPSAKLMLSVGWALVVIVALFHLALFARS
jgi:hypothetical protein